MKPSFLTSTLSLMALLSLLSVMYCVARGLTIPGELLGVFTGIIGAYTGSRMPGVKPDITPIPPTIDTPTDDVKV